MSAPVTELGWAGGRGSWWAEPQDDETPELRWPNSVRVYDQMRRQDGQVKSVLRALTLPVRRTTWRIDPAGARPEVVALIADDLGLPVLGEDKPAPRRTRDRFSWSQHLGLSLLSLAYGHMYFEQVYRLDEQGRARLRKLAPRMPRTLSAVNVADDGGLVSIEQHAPPNWRPDGGMASPTIPVSRLVGYVNEQEGGDWLGTSVLRPAYKNWAIKDRLLRVQAQTIERNGMGVPVYEAAPKEPDLTAGQKLATSFRSGDTAGAAIQNGAKLTLAGVQGSLPNADPAIRYHDEQIARGSLLHFLNLGTQTGSWALGSTFADFFILGLQALADEHRDIANMHIVEDLVDVNFGEDEPAPLLVCDQIGSQQQVTAQAMQMLITAGALSNDPALERHIRQRFGLPAPDPDAPPVVPEEVA